MGVVPDYTDLAIQLGATGKYLYRDEKWYRDFHARTKTPADGSLFVCVGYHVPNLGLLVNEREPDSGYDDVYVVPLIVPA